MSATIHFQCSFDLERVHPVSEGWDDLMDEILLWIKVRTPPLQAITFEEFSQGGRWNENRHIVETVYDRGDSEHGAPRLWAMRFSRPDLNHWQRIWSTDFGISSSSSGKFHLSVTIGHSLAQEYICLL